MLYRDGREVHAVYMATSPAQASGYVRELHKKNSNQVEKRQHACGLWAVSRTRASCFLQLRDMVEQAGWSRAQQEPTNSSLYSSSGQPVTGTLVLTPDTTANLGKRHRGRLMPRLRELGCMGLTT